MAIDQTNLTVTPRYGFCSVAHNYYPNSVLASGLWTTTNQYADELFRAGSNGSKIEEIAIADVDSTGLNVSYPVSLIIATSPTYPVLAPTAPSTYWGAYIEQFDWVLLTTGLALPFRSSSASFASGTCRPPNFELPSGYSLWVANYANVTTNNGKLSAMAWGGDF